jgi:hypothetical protein
MTTLKELKDEKKQYENYIIDYMEENHNVEVSIPEGKIKKAMLKSLSFVTRWFWINFQSFIITNK